MRRLAIAALVAMSLCGCVDRGSEGVMQGDSDVLVPSAEQRFVTDNPLDRFGTVVDSHTGVTYLVWKRNTGYGGIGSITVLINSDGTPVIAEETTK